MEVTAYSEELDFQKYWLVLKRRWIPATATLAFFLGLGFLYSVSQRKTVYKAESQILIKQDKSAELTGISNNTGDIDQVNKLSSPLATQAQIIKSRPVLEKVVTQLDLKDDDGEPWTTGILAAQLEVETIEATDILSISYKGKDPELVTSIVNAVVDSYRDYDQQTNNQEATQALRFIEDQLPGVEVAVRKADADLRQFKEANQVADLEQESRELIETLGILDRNVADAEAQLADANAQYVALRNQVGMDLNQALAANALSQSEGVQQVLDSLQAVQVELASERSRFSESNPQVVNLRERETALNTLLRERIGNTVGTRSSISPRILQMGSLEQGLINNFVSTEVSRAGLADQLQILKTAQADYRRRLTVIPRLEQAQRQLERRLEAAQSTYQTLLTKKEEAEVIQNQDVGKVNIISEALLPDSPLPDNSKLIVMAGGFVGLVAGVGVAFLLDLIDKSVKTVQEAKEIFGYTMLGMIPIFDQSGKVRPQVGNGEMNIPRVVIRDMAQSPVRESYQMLQANLKYISSDQKNRSIVVTSSVAGEGKSEVSANLAATMAQVGNRVLLIDGDMRRPTQHHVWGLTNAVGLSNVLIGEVEWDEATEEVMPGLDVITSGVIPPNPVALLDSQRMAKLTEMFSAHYDYVIFDTPPLNGIADTTILGKMADGVLLVTRPQVVDSASAKATKELILRTNQNILGVVANGIKIHNKPDGYFYYREDQYQKTSHATLERV